VALRAGQYSHDLIVEEAFEFVRSNAARPFFLFLALTIPHASLEVPADSLARYLGRFPETPFTGPHFAPQPTPHAAYAAMIDRFDESVGRLLRLLDELGLDERTVVFLTSDNGPHRAGGGDPEFFRSAGPLRGIKRDLYEGGIRVPMLVRWPGRIAPGTVSARPWAFWDFLPTAAELAGLPAPAALDGGSVVPTLLGQRQPEAAFLYWEALDGGFRQAIRQGRWKALRLEGGTVFELYDLESDLGERRNVAAANPEVVARLGKLFQTARTRPSGQS
jgi:arylsulfatase A-like enzyme